MEELNVIGKKAKKAATQLAHLNTEQKNRVLDPGCRTAGKKCEQEFLKPIQWIWYRVRKWG